MTRRHEPRPARGCRYYFREWRKFRRLTQEELAGRIDMSASSISQLESGKQGFSQDTLESLATALECSPGALLLINPLDKRSPWALWEQLTPEKRQHVLAVMEAMAGTEHNRAA